jgi:hypothetical protein
LHSASKIKLENKIPELHEGELAAYQLFSTCTKPKLWFLPADSDGWPALGKSQ